MHSEHAAQFTTRHLPLNYVVFLHPAAGAGLRPQHLTGLQLIAELCSGRLQGGEVGSSCITLQPGRLACGRHVADTRTAGSCMLLAQSALPCLLYAGDGEPAAAPEAAQGAAAAAAAEGAPWLQAACARGTASVLDLRGGTDAAMAPPVGYMQHVLLPTLRSRLGVRAALERGRRGFFPKGQGHVTLAVERLAPGACLPALDLTQRGEVTSITIRAFTAGRLVPTIGERLAAAAQKGGWMGAQGWGARCVCSLGCVASAALAACREQRTEAPPLLFLIRRPLSCCPFRRCPLCRGQVAHAALRRAALGASRCGDGARAPGARVWRRLRHPADRRDLRRLRAGRLGYVLRLGGERMLSEATVYWAAGLLCWPKILDNSACPPPPRAAQAWASGACGRRTLGPGPRGSCWMRWPAGRAPTSGCRTSSSFSWRLQRRVLWGLTCAYALGGGAGTPCQHAVRLLHPTPHVQGRSRMLTGEPTLHTRTACMVAQALTAARFSIRPAPGGGGLYMIECEGAGVAAPGGGAESGQQAGRAAPGGGS